MKSIWKRNLMMLWFSQLLVMAGFDAMNPFVPIVLKTGLGLNDAASQAFFISMYNACAWLGYGFSNPLWGWLGDRYGMKPMLLRGTFLTAIFWPLMAYTTSPWLFVFLRFATAFLAGTTAASQMMIARTAPMERQGYAQGILSTAIWGGSVLGNLLGGMLLTNHTYHIVFWSCGIMYLIAGISILFTEDAGEKRIPAQTTAPSAPQTGRRFAPFRLAAPVWIMLALFLLMGIIRRTELPFLALRVEEFVPAGKSAYWTGIFSAVSSIGAMLSGVILGHAVDKIHFRKLLPPVLVFTALFLGIQANCRSIPIFAVARMLMFFSAGAIQPLLQKWLATVAPRNQRGISFGLSTTGMAIGGLFASTIGGLLMLHFESGGVFWGAAALTLISVFIYIPCLVAVERMHNAKTETSFTN
ncbi:MAG: MFS transporter [Lentisphaeria bacterium]|nr:MFS transporter [Lentisphaeria bacterium]